MTNLDELQNTDKFVRVPNEEIPEPVVYKEKITGNHWFVTTRRPVREVLDLYVALVDLGSGEMKYDSRKAYHFSPRREKPSVSELTNNRNRFESVKVTKPLVYRSIVDKNLYFIDDNKKILDGYICLWDLHGTLKWQAREKDEQKFLDSVRKTLETLIEIPSNPIVQLLFTGFGISLPAKLANELKKIAPLLQKNDFDMGDIIDFAGSKELNEAREIFDLIKSKVGDGKISFEELLGFLGDKPAIKTNIQEMKDFFTGSKKISADDAVKFSGLAFWK